MLFRSTVPDGSVAEQKRCIELASVAHFWTLLHRTAPRYTRFWARNKYRLSKGIANAQVGAKSKAQLLPAIALVAKRVCNEGQFGAFVDSYVQRGTVRRNLEAAHAFNAAKPIPSNAIFFSAL